MLEVMFENTPYGRLMGFVAVPFLFCIGFFVVAVLVIFSFIICAAIWLAGLWFGYGRVSEYMKEKWPSKRKTA